MLLSLARYKFALAHTLNLIQLPSLLLTSKNFGWYTMEELFEWLGDSVKAKTRNLKYI